MTDELTTEEIKKLAEALSGTELKSCHKFYMQDDYSKEETDLSVIGSHEFDPINNGSDSDKVFTALHEICRPLNIEISIFQGVIEVFDENGKHITKRLRCNNYSIAIALLAVLECKF